MTLKTFFQTCEAFFKTLNCFLQLAVLVARLSLVGYGCYLAYCFCCVARFQIEYLMTESAFARTMISWTTGAYIYTTSDWVFLVLFVMLGISIVMSFLEKRLYRHPPIVYNPQRFEANSPYASGPLPSYQANVYGVDEAGNTYKSGQGFRVKGEFFLTAGHVVSNYPEFMLTTSTAKIIIPRERFVEVEGDLAVLHLSPVEATTLALTVAKLHPMEFTETQGVYAKVTGYGVYSMGLVAEHRAFGFCTYAGSTAGGFSGAPYAVGNTVYGMHLGGSSSNIGYSSAYLSMVVSSLQEDTQDQMEREMRSYGKATYRRSAYNPDEYVVKIGGKYHIVDEDDMHSFMTKHKGAVNYQGENPDAEQIVLTRKPEKVEIAKPAPVVLSDPTEAVLLKDIQATLSTLMQGNAKAPVANATGAVGKAQLSEPIATPARRRNSEGTSSLSQKVSDLNIRPEIRAQSNEVLRSISSCLKKLRREQGSFQRELSNKSLKTPQGISKLGQLTSVARKINEIISIVGLPTDLQG